MAAATATTMYAVLVVMLCCLAHSSYARQFVAGGRDGWVLKPSEDYAHWASRNRFLVNDTILFKYKKGSDSVLVVKKEDYDKCNVDSPLLKLDDGDSVFKFDRSGPFYFISGNKSSCDQGQKLTTVVISMRTPPSSPKVSPPAPSPGGGGGGGGAEAPFVPYGGAPAPATSGSGPSTAPPGSGNSPSGAPEGSSGSGSGSAPSPAPEGSSGSGSGPSPSGAPEGSSGSGSGPSPAPEGSGSGYSPSPSPEGSGSGSGSEGPSPAGGSSGSPSSSTMPGSPGSSPPGSSTAGGPGSSMAPGGGTPADANSPPGAAAAPPCSASLLLVSIVLSFGAIMVSP